MGFRVVQANGVGDYARELSRLLAVSRQSQEVRDLALSVIGNSSEPLLAVYSWTKANVRYVPDPAGTELFTSPVRMAKDYSAGKPLAEDCDGHSLINAALLGAVGYKNRIALVGYYGQEITHAYAEVWSSKLGQWIPVDTTSEKPLGWITPESVRVLVEAQGAA